MKRICIVLFICQLFSCCNVDTLPQRINYMDKLNLADLKKIDTQIEGFQLNDYNDDELYDLLIIFILHIKNSDKIQYVYAQYENTGRYYKLHHYLEDEKMDYAIWAELFNWNNYNSRTIGNQQIYYINKDDFSPVADGKINEYLNRYFILKGMFIHTIFYNVFEITEDSIKRIQIISDDIKYAIKNKFMNTVELINLNLSKEREMGLVGGDGYVRKYQSYIFQLKERKLIANNNITEISKNLIEKDLNNIFKQKGDIDSLYELFFFYYYNKREIINEEWIKQKINELKVKHNQLNSLIQLFDKRLELDDEAFNLYYNIDIDINEILSESHS